MSPKRLREIKARNEEDKRLRPIGLGTDSIRRVERSCDYDQDCKDVDDLIAEVERLQAENQMLRNYSCDDYED